MAFVDKRIMPKSSIESGHVTLNALLDHFANCYECPSLTAANLGPIAHFRPPKPRPIFNAPRSHATTHAKPSAVRFAADINAAIREFAVEMGISFNAALSVLVSEALIARGRRTPKRPG